MRMKHIPAKADAGLQIPPALPGAPLAPRQHKSNNTCLITSLIIGGVAVMLIFVLAILAAIMLPALARAREAARRASCQNNLKQMGLVYKMFTNENKKGQFPLLSPVKGDFSFVDEDLYHEYLMDLAVLVCPSDPTPADTNDPEACLGDESYFYLGYAMTNENEARAFLDAYEKSFAESGGASFEGDLPVEPGMGTGGGDVIQRLGEEMKLFAEEDSRNVARLQSEIPVMFDREVHHIPNGVNVLYMDGHVEFVKMGVKFPAQQWFLDALADLEK